MERFATEVKQGRLLTYLSDIARDDENLVKQMKYNGACEWMEDRLVIHNGGVMYGPYLTMPPMQYKLCVEVNYEEAQHRCPQLQKSDKMSDWVRCS